MDKRRSEGGGNGGSSLRDDARSHVAANNSPPVSVGQRANRGGSVSGRNSGNSTGRQQGESDHDYEQRMLRRIGGMTEPEWQYHRSVFRNSPVAQGRRGRRNGLNVDQAVLDFMAYREQRRGRGAGNVRAPTTNRRRQPWQVALDSALNGNVAMMNESSDYEELFQAMAELEDQLGLGGRRTGGRAGRGRGGRGRGRRRGGLPYAMPGFPGGLMGQDPAGDDYEQLLELAEQLGAVKQKTGMSTNEINMLPTKVFSTSSLKEGESAPECHVCMCEYEEGETLRILTCFHNFHQECIDKWIKGNPSCPVCRSEVKVT